MKILLLRVFLQDALGGRSSVGLFWPRGYKTFSMLNSTEHGIFLLINVKMPSIVGILTFMGWKNSIIGLS